MENLHQTPLHDRHVDAAARLVPFAGWEMPVQYEGIRAEHVRVRTHAGMFDVSHMGQIETRGPDALRFLQRLLSNDVARMPELGAQYSVLCREDGGVLDDLFTYRLAPERYLTVTNASNHDRDFSWLVEHSAGLNVEILDRQQDYAMLAVQGPAARRIVAAAASGELPARFRVAELDIAGRPALVCGTGEDGVEILVAPESATAVWDALLEHGVEPVGLGARDTLRLEACFHLYGNELSEDRGPIEAGLGWCCKEDTGFIGADAVRRDRVRGTTERLVPFTIAGDGIARHGNRVLGGGVVTSGAPSPSLGVAIGMAFLPSDAAQVGRPFEIDVRGRTRTAQVVSRPIYRREAS
jgi:aminomethyltransferase